MDWENLLYALIIVAIVIGVLWWAGFVHIDYDASINTNQYVTEFQETLKWNILNWSYKE